MGKTRKNRRGHSRHRGGAIIGKGGSGAIFAPPLLCTQPSQVYGDEYVSKIFFEEASRLEGIEIEYGKGSLVRELDPEGRWSITPEARCVLAKEQSDEEFEVSPQTTQQIIYRNGGVPLSSLIYGSNGKLLPPERLNYKLYIHCLKQLMDILPILHTRYLHDDLHSGNIVYNEHDGRVRIIDFGYLQTLDDATRSDIEKFKNRYEITDATCLDQVKKAHYDLVKQRDYSELFREVCSVIIDYKLNKMRPYDEWINRWSENEEAGTEGAILRAVFAGTIRCKMYADAIRSLPDHV